MSFLRKTPIIFMSNSSDLIIQTGYIFMRNIKYETYNE